MAIPVVQNLQDLISKYRAAYAPQNTILDQSITDAGTQGESQVAGLNARAQQEYKNIAQTAQNKGMAFSGFTPNEQANYNATTLLPSIANIQNTIANTRAALLGKKAELDTSANTAAIGEQSQQQSSANSWQAAQDAADRAAAEQEKQRQFEASQNAAKIAADQAASSKSTALPPISQGIAQAFLQVGYKPANQGGVKFATENQVIPAVAADYGISLTEAKKLVYAYRKQTYGE